MSRTLPALDGGQRRYLLQRLIAVGVAQGTMAVVTALTVRFIVDNLMQAGMPPSVYLMAGIGGVLLAIAAATAWLRWRERLEAEAIGQDYARETRLMLFNHLSRVPARSLQRHRKGGVMLRFVSDLSALRQWISLGIARLVIAGLTLLGVLCALLLVAWKLALIVAVVVALGAILSWRMGKPLHHAVRATRRRHARLAGNIGEMTAVMGVVQAFGQWRREQRRIAQRSNDLYRATLERADHLGRLRAVAEIAAAGASGSVLMLGVWEVSASRMTAGSVVAALAIIGLLVPSLRSLGRVHEYWHAARVSRDNLQRLLRSSKRLRLRGSAPDMSLLAGRIELSGVAVEGSLQATTICAEAGQRIAIVGPNGAGKSTLLAAIARLIEIDRGKVLIDNQDLRRCKLASIRKHIGIMSPGLPLLQGSIERNIRYRQPAADPHALELVSHWCDLESLYAELPQGSSTRLSEGGTNLSQGQAARIALARALFGNPPILLLDEVDANLDPDARRLVEKILHQYQGTILLVTHRTTLLANVERIWKMRRGVLSEDHTDRGDQAEAISLHPSLVFAS